MMARQVNSLLFLSLALLMPAYAAGESEESPADSGPGKSSPSTRIVLAGDHPRAVVSAVAKQLDGAGRGKANVSPDRAGPPGCLRHHPEQTVRSSERWGSVLTDIARHLPASARYEDAFQRYTRAGDLVTAGHEWTHFLNEYLSSQSGNDLSAFYVLGSRYFVLSIPRKLLGIVPEVPRTLRGELYDLYLVQNSGNARVDPLYLLDEWTAYSNDVTIAVDQLSEGKSLNPFHPEAIQTMTAGNVLEFTFYGFALGMAVKKHDPAYYASEEGQKLRDFIAFNARRSMEIYGQALQRSELSDGDSRNLTMMRHFRDAADTATMRAWVATDLGEDLAGLLGLHPRNSAALGNGPAPARQRSST